MLCGRLLAALAVGAISLTACANSAVSSATGGGVDGPLKIGMLTPVTGVLAPLGQDQVDGFNLYLHEHHGELGGRKVELVTEDTEGLPDVAFRKANRLIEQDQVQIATGVINSAEALQIQPLFTESKIPLVLSGASANSLTGRDRSDYVFRTFASSWQLSYPAGKWIDRRYGGAPLYLAAPDFAAGHEILDGIKSSYQETGGVVAGESFSPFGQTQDFQPYLSKISRSGAKVAYAFYAGGEAVNFVKQYEEFGLQNKVPLVGPGSTTDVALLPAEGSAAKGVYSVLPYTWTMKNPKNSEFVTDYLAAYHRPPSYFAVASYDAAQLIDLALSQTKGDTDSEQLVQAMEGAELASPRGKLTIDPTTHGTVQEMYMSRIEDVDGQLAPVVVDDLGQYGEQP